MTYGTRGTLRPRKPAEDYDLDTLDDELYMTVVVAALLAVIVAGWIVWWVWL